MHRQSRSPFVAVLVAAALAIVMVGTFGGSPSLAAGKGGGKPSPTGGATPTGGPAPSGPQSACQSLGGSFSSSTTQWSCTYPAGAASSVPAPSLDAACPGVSVWTFSRAKKVSMVSYTCSHG